MAAPRKPDRELQAAMEEARKRREEAQATFDRKVKRAHGGGATIPDMARDLGKSDNAVSDSLKRLNLTPNEDALFLRRRHG